MEQTQCAGAGEGVVESGRRARSGGGSWGRPRRGHRAEQVGVVAALEQRAQCGTKG